jgi:hypothetical protein
MAAVQQEKNSRVKAFFKAIFLRILKSIFEMKDKGAAAH